MAKTVNEGFGTIYDRVWKAEIIKKLKDCEHLTSITEIDVGIPLIHSGGVGLDTLLLRDEFSDIQIVYFLEENGTYAKKFLPDSTLVSYEQFISGKARTTDILFGNYIIEFIDDLEEFFEIANRYKYVVLFESNHINFGHKLVHLVGKRFMIAPWVEYKSCRKTTPPLALAVLETLDTRVVTWGMIDFPFFAPASGVSPFKMARKRRDSFDFQPLSTLNSVLIRVGMNLERWMPQFVRYFSHMFYVICKGRL
jgi:hypothetical protein